MSFNLIEFVILRGRRCSQTLLFERPTLQHFVMESIMVWYSARRKISISVGTQPPKSTRGTLGIRDAAFIPFIWMVISISMHVTGCWLLFGTVLFNLVLLLFTFFPIWEAEKFFLTHSRSWCWWLHKREGARPLQTEFHYWWVVFIWFCFHFSYIILLSHLTKSQLVFSWKVCACLHICVSWGNFITLH